MARLKLMHLAPYENSSFWQKLEPNFSPYHRSGLLRGLKKAGFNVRLIDNRGGHLQHGASWAEMLLDQVAKFHPDILMLSDNSATPAKIKMFKELFPDMFTFFYFYDQDRALTRRVSELGKVCDALFLNNQDPPQWQNYQTAGVQNIQCWHQGVDPEIYYPLHYNLDRCDFDLIFIGSDKSTQPRYLDYSNRERQFLIYNTAWQYKMLIVGRWWDPKQLCFYLPAAFESDANYQMSRARIVLGVQNYREIYGSTSNRTWLSLATGRMFLVTKFAGIEEMFVNRKHLVWYENIQELFELIDYYRRHPSAAVRIGQSGRRLIEKYHTYYHRALELKQMFRRWRKGQLPTPILPEKQPCSN